MEFGELLGYVTWRGPANLLQVFAAFALAAVLMSVASALGRPVALLMVRQRFRGAIAWLYGRSSPPVRCGTELRS